MASAARFSLSSSRARRLSRLEQVRALERHRREVGERLDGRQLLPPERPPRVERGDDERAELVAELAAHRADDHRGGAEDLPGLARPVLAQLGVMASISSGAACHASTRGSISGGRERQPAHRGLHRDLEVLVREPGGAARAVRVLVGGHEGDRGNGQHRAHVLDEAQERPLAPGGGRRRC